jgi:asparaginyl-tRNA synthetase
MALGKIYTFGPSFRAENSNTPRHVAEFWHVEPEVAFAELPDIIAIAEDMIKYIIKDILKKCPDELAFFDAHFEKGLLDKLNSLVETDFAVLDYTEAIDILKKADKEFAYPCDWGCDLQTEHERYITEEVFKKPVFIINYPKAIKSFYMKQNPDGKTVAATDLLVPGVGEIIGCSEREADYDKLLSAMKERNMDLDAYTDYLELRKFGSVPHSGFGLGFERILMYVTGISNIRDVILYPRTVGNVR